MENVDGLVIVAVMARLHKKVFGAISVVMSGYKIIGIEMDNMFTMGDWVTGIAEWGKADGVADELSVNRAYLVTGIEKNGFLRLLCFMLPVDPIYLRCSTAREITETKLRHGFKNNR